jgi:hypothetical protein
MTPPDRAQLIREALLGFLAPRQALKFSAEDLVERLQRSNKLDFRPEAEEIVAAIAFLENFKPEPLVHHDRAQLGRTLYYQATSAGVLAHERGTLEE